jgi:hypothetical protein
MRGQVVQGKWGLTREVVEGEGQVLDARNVADARRGWRPLADCMRAVV